KWLYVIQSKTVVRPGESTPRPLNGRIITATYVNTHREVTERQFREYFLYRISTMEIELPPLRKLISDIAGLANFLLEKIKHKYEKFDLSFDQKLLSLLENYSRKGNIREIENKIERAVILADSNLISVHEMNILYAPLIESAPDEISVNDFEKI